MWHKNEGKKDAKIHKIENILTLPQIIHKMAMSKQTHLCYVKANPRINDVISQKLTGLLLSINFRPMVFKCPCIEYN